MSGDPILRRTVLAALLSSALVVPSMGRGIAAQAATITGRVVTTDATPQPVRRAIVTVSGGGIPNGLSIVTDDDGRFAFGDLPAGRMSVTVAKRGWLNGAFGARRPGGAGTPIVLAAGATMSITVALTRAGVITGTITSERGVPIQGLRVFAIDARNPAIPQPVGGDNGALTDDRGVYRLYGLAPREYVVCATAVTTFSTQVGRRTVEETDAVLARLRARTAAAPGLVPTTAAATPPASAAAAPLSAIYYPGAPSLANATRIKVGPGEVREGVSFVMSIVPVTTIEGTVISLDGRLPASLEMAINPGNTLQFFALAGASPQLVQRPGADGRFKYATIAPGHYTILVRANATAPAGGPRGTGAGAISGASAAAAPGFAADTLYAVEELDVTGQPVTGVSLRLQRGARLSGRVVLRGASQATERDTSAVRIRLVSLATDSGMTIGGTTVGNAFATSPPVAPRADGSFEMFGLASGTYRLEVSTPGAAPSVWRPRSAMSGSLDLLDTTVHVELGTDISDVVVTLTDERASLTGSLQSSAGIPAPEYVVIVMPADVALRATAVRRIQSARPATDGTFGFNDLPAGDYLLVALTDVEPDELRQPEFLSSIAPGGVRITIADGERKTQDLRIR